MTIIEFIVIFQDESKDRKSKREAHLNHIIYSNIRHEITSIHIALKEENYFRFRTRLQFFD